MSLVTPFVINNRLDLKEHVESVAKGILRHSFALRIISGNIGGDVALRAYYTFVAAKVRYGLIVSRYCTRYKLNLSATKKMYSRQRSLLK